MRNYTVVRIVGILLIVILILISSLSLATTTHSLKLGESISLIEMLLPIKWWLILSGIIGYSIFAWAEQENNKAEPSPFMVDMIVGLGAKIMLLISFILGIIGISLLFA